MIAIGRESLESKEPVVIIERAEGSTVFFSDRIGARLQIEGLIPSYATEGLEGVMRRERELDETFSRLK